MINRWTILATLFLSRFAMAFQFQSVAALSPFLADTYGVGLGEIGLLIGLYLAPGVVVALPGGGLAAWLGDRRIVIASMVLMLIGALLAAYGGGWGAVMAGRILAGAGGVVVNIIMTKMVVDWFSGREISTALAVFINSWPVGIAVALIALPPVAEAGGLEAARAVVIGTIAAVLALFLAVYRAPPGLEGERGAVALSVRGLPVLALVLAGLIWAFYNTALALMFSFGGPALAALGWSVPAANALTSAFVVACSVFLPLGGILADRTGRRDAVILWGLLGFAVLVPLLPVAGTGIALPVLIVAAGAVLGLAAGPIMALPSDVLTPPVRAFGMGVFFTLYYVVMMAAPGLAGSLAERLGDATIIFPLAAGIAVICVALLGWFRAQRRVPVAAG